MHLMIKNLIDQFDLVDLDHIHDDMGSKQVEYKFNITEGKKTPSVLL